MSMILIIVLAFVASVPGPMQTSAKQPVAKPSSLTLSDCDVRGVEGKAKCGTYEVYEDRATKKGRRLSLKIIVLPATGPKTTDEQTSKTTGGQRLPLNIDRATDPLFYISGGPGSSATEDAPGIAGLLAKIREHRDLVFLDQRGTGGSHPLKCDFYNAADLQSYLGYFFPLDEVRKCRQQLERDADLTLYTTPIAMDDLDEVRTALGYQKINIFGGSYGTRAALVYLKRHPQHVRTLILQGVAPTNQFMPRDFAPSNERALQGILAECSADKTCNGAFPNLRAETKAVLDRLLQGPIEVEVAQINTGPGPANPTQGSRPKVKLSRDLAAEAIRYMLYNPTSASRVPLFLHLAAQGDFAPLAMAALRYRQGIVATGSNGLYLSITCAEDLPWIKPGEGETLSENTFLGDYRLRQQREACALWPRATIPTDYRVPVRSPAPVLMLTGELDPVTPPSNAEAVARSLPNSLHVIVPHGAHGFGGLEGIDCIVRLLKEFVESGTAKGLDTSCVKSIRRRGFALKQ